MISQKTREILFHLNLIENIGPATIEKIIAGSDLSFLENIYFLSSEQICQSFKLSQKTADLIFKGLKNLKLLIKS